MYFLYFSAQVCQGLKVTLGFREPPWPLKLNDFNNAVRTYLRIAKEQFANHLVKNTDCDERTDHSMAKKYKLSYRSLFESKSRK